MEGGGGCENQHASHALGAALQARARDVVRHGAARVRHLQHVGAGTLAEHLYKNMIKRKE